MELKTHELNIPQIRAAVQAFGEVWVHGSGDIFRLHDTLDPKSRDQSQIHADNVVPGYEEGQYRVKINRNNMPKNKTELDEMLMRAKAYGDQEKNQQKTGDNGLINIKVDDSYFGGDFTEPAGDIDYSKYVKK